mmetsp:Transcript_21390/g.48390  ORF Transcript_21390/g.48390 Transcript_21390/m.48390 type:complete len:206 (+) Transcript_21390:933-1550(+)
MVSSELRNPLLSCWPARRIADFFCSKDSSDKSLLCIPSHKLEMGSRRATTRSTITPCFSRPPSPSPSFSFFCAMPTPSSSGLRAPWSCSALSIIASQTARRLPILPGWAEGTGVGRQPGALFSVSMRVNRCASSSTDKRSSSSAALEASKPFPLIVLSIVISMSPRFEEPDWCAGDPGLFKLPGVNGRRSSRDESLMSLSVSTAF